MKKLNSTSEKEEEDKISIKELFLEKNEDHKQFGFCIRGGKNSALGIFVTNIKDGSQADIKGLKNNDFVLKINDIDATKLNLNEASEIFYKSKLIKLQIMRNSATSLRNGKPKRKTIAKFTDFTLEKAKIVRPSLGDSFGFTINSVFETKSLDCICISGIKKDAPAFLSNIKVGDEILKVNGKAINNIDDFYEVLNIIKNALSLTMFVKRNHSTIKTIITKINQDQENVKQIDLTQAKSRPKSKIDKRKNKEVIKALISQLSDTDEISESENIYECIVASSKSLSGDELDELDQKDNESVNKNNKEKKIKSSSLFSLIEALNDESPPCDRKFSRFTKSNAYLNIMNETSTDSEVYEMSSKMYKFKEVQAAPKFLKSAEKPSLILSNMIKKDRAKLNSKKTSVAYLKKEIESKRESATLNVSQNKEDVNNGVKKRPAHFKKKNSIESTDSTKLFHHDYSSEITQAWSECCLLNIESETVIPESPVLAELVVSYEYEYVKENEDIIEFLVDENYEDIEIETLKQSISNSLEYTQDGLINIDVVKQVVPMWPKNFGLKLKRNDNNELAVANIEPGSASELLKLFEIDMILLKIDNDEFITKKNAEEAEKQIEEMFDANQSLRFLIKPA